MSTKPRARLARAAAAAAIVGLVAGCSTVNLTSDRIEYQSAPAPRTLEIPPDLSQLPRDDRYAVPDRAGAARVLEQLANAESLVLGPGLTTHPSTRKLVWELVRHSPVPVVLDADGIKGLLY